MRSPLKPIYITRGNISFYNTHPQLSTEFKNMPSKARTYTSLTSA